MSSRIKKVDTLLTPEIIEKAKKVKNSYNFNQKINLRIAFSWFFLTDTIKRKIRLEIEKKLKVVDLYSVIITVTSIVIEIIESGIYIKTKEVVHDNKVTVVIETKPNYVLEILRGIVSILTVFLIVLVCFHYRIKKFLLVFKQEYDINSNFYSTQLLFPLIIELIICIIHTPPYFNNVKVSFPAVDSEDSGSYDVDLIIFIKIFIQLKWFVLVKYLLNYSKWGDDRANRICKEGSVSHSILFILKSELKEHDIFIIIFFFIANMIIFGYCLRLCEIAFIKDVPMKYYQNWNSLWNGFWCIFVSSTTIGYGDFTPRTIMGRCIAIIASFIGLVLFGMFILGLMSYFSMDADESKAYDEILIISYLKKVQKTSLELILAYYRLMRIIDFYENKPVSSELFEKWKKKKKKGIAKLLKLTRKNFILRTTLEELIKGITVEKELYQINATLNETLELIVSSSKVEINALISRIKYSQDLSSILKGYSIMLKTMYDRLNRQVQDAGRKSLKFDDS